MKKIIAIASVVLITGAIKAQDLKEADVPAKVKDAFAKKYPGVKAEWEKEDAEYEAEFELNKIESSAVFDANGVFKELEQEIKITELPAIVTEYCSKNFTGFKLTEAAKITDASGKVMYEAEMSKGKEHFDALFDDKGNFIKKSMAAESEKD